MTSKASGRLWLLLAFVLGSPACSSDDGGGGQTPEQDAATDSEADAGPDSTADAPPDVPTETFGLPFCTELGADKVQPNSTLIANTFGTSVFADCRVLQLFLPLSQPEKSTWLQNTALWTEAFFGCPGTAGHVTSFGPVETGKSPILTPTDIDLFVELFAVATEKTLTLSSAQSAALRVELAKVGATAVTLNIPGHGQSLCVDGGSDAGSDGGVDGATDGAVDGGSDAEPEAGNDAGDGGTDT